MIDLIVFTAGNNHYALDIENIQRIIQAKELAEISNAHKLIDGMMSYENKVIKVLNFRKLINLSSYEEELKKLFLRFKMEHQNWINELKDSVDNGLSFGKTTDPHKCELGIWLDSFNSYNEDISAVLKELMQNHTNLHVMGMSVLELSKTDKEAAQKMLDTDVYHVYNNTVSTIDIFMNSLQKVANSLQKLILYEKDNNYFAIKVDAIEDIAHIDESTTINEDEENSISEFLELKGVLDIDGVLINIIKTINIPK